MRKIVLTSNDFELFDTEIGSVEFEFFHKHKDAFKRMWREQVRLIELSVVLKYYKFGKKEYSSIVSTLLQRLELSESTQKSTCYRLE